MDWLKTELATFMALQLACEAISSTTPTTKTHDEFWKQLRILGVLLEYHLDKSSTLFKSDEVGKEISKLAEECLRSSWLYITDLYGLTYAETPWADRGPPGRNLLDTRFLLPFWLGSVEKQKHKAWTSEIEPKLKNLSTVDGLITTLISAFSNRTDVPDLLPTAIMDDYHNSTESDRTTKDLRRSVITTYQPSDQREAFYDISAPCPGTLDWALETTKKDPRSVLTSGETLTAWLKSCDYSNNICWISGDPGSGKSMLMGHIVTRARSDPSLFEAYPRHARRNGYGKPIFIWHSFQCYDRATDPESMQRQELIMIQSILLQLFKHFPVTMDRAFADTYNMILSQRKPDYIKAGLSIMKFRILENTLLFFLADTGLVRSRVFIFLDGPNGFSRQKSDFLNPSEEEDSPLIYKLQGIRDVKVCIATRPGGMFHDWGRSFHGRDERGDRFPTLRLENSTREDIQTFCRKYLKFQGVLLPLRLRLAEIIARASEGSFFLAQYGCADAFRGPEEEPGDLPAWLRSIPRSHIFFDSLLHEIEKMPSTFSLRNYPFVSENRLETLSTYLNIIITYTKHNISQSRNQRPLSLLQFTLAIGSYRNILPPSDSLTQFQRNELAAACDNIAHKIRKELYPIIVLREMDDREKPQGVEAIDKTLGEQEQKALIRAAGSKVMLLHSNLGDYLETCSVRGQILLGNDTDQRANPLVKLERKRQNSQSLVEIPEDRENPDFVRDRVTRLLRASLFEHALLMPEKVTEECEEWLEGGTGSEMKEAEPNRRYPTTRSKAASIRVRGLTPQPYRPYREHLKFLGNYLPGVVGLENEMLDWEFWPLTFVKQIKVEPEEESVEDQGGSVEVVREMKRRRMG